MSDHTVQVLHGEDDLRAAYDLLRHSLHAPPSSTEDWQQVRNAYQEGNTLGVFDDTLIGTARFFDSELVLPGGGMLPTAAVTGVGVRPNRTRRGVLTELMRTQLTDLAERGIAVAGLIASEGLIYGRFGYGIATTGRSYTVDRRRAVFRPEIPHEGQVDLFDLDTALERLPAVYRELSPRWPGMLTRNQYWWPAAGVFMRRTGNPVTAAVHYGPGGADGFAIYEVARPDPARGAVLKLMDFHYGSFSAFAGLWRYLLGVDLVGEIEASGRPQDEYAELLFTDPRAVRVNGASDALWLRLVDVPGALRARERGQGTVVLEVVDPVLEHNSGRYLVSADEVTEVTAPAGLRLHVDTLAMIYLGGWRPSALAEAGRIEVADPAAVAAADSLFATHRTAWCGTFF
ncbi:GNAT family N-acetyltransferase [Amycolatopsis aidingensis]|uniref:GNAT family N-acetyltransferase n=1 Tax=Amycolatopsis aidingensis TaxID=2842453 RepID=UPI001C0AC202|nr:GNAT family N-acetyltransferase [Amycolatopsis aidingensis]